MEKSAREICHLPFVINESGHYVLKHNIEFMGKETAIKVDGTHDVHIDFGGNKLVLDNVRNGILINKSENVIVEGGKIVGLKPFPNNVDNAIWIQYSNRVIVKDLVIEEVNVNGVFVGFDSTNILVETCSTKNVYNGVLVGVGSKAVDIKGCSFTGHGKIFKGIGELCFLGIYIFDRARNVLVKGCNFYNIDNGIFIIDPSDYYGLGVANISIDDCFIENAPIDDIPENFLNGVYVYGLNNKIQNVTIKGLKLVSHTQGINVNNVEGFQLMDSQIIMEGSRFYGVVFSNYDVDMKGTCNNVVVDNIQLVSNGTKNGFSAIQFLKGSGANVSNVVTNLNGDASWGMQFSNYNDAKITNCIMAGRSEIGILIIESKNIIIDGLQVTESQIQLLSIVSQGVTVIGGQYGGVNGQFSIGIAYIDSINSAILSNVVTGNSISVLAFGPPDTVLIQGNKVFGNGSDIIADGQVLDGNIQFNNQQIVLQTAQKPKTFKTLPQSKVTTKAIIEEIYNKHVSKPKHVESSKQMQKFNSNVIKIYKPF